MMEILFPGPLTTVQDAGCTGYAALGYPERGAADKYAMRLANILAGNGFGSPAAVLEFTFTGPDIRFECGALIALAGAPCHPSVDGQAIPCFAPVFVEAGSTLHTGSVDSGLRGTLAVYGGVDVPRVMGSRATDLKCHIGGLQGRALRAGDRLPIGAQASCAGARYRAIRQALCRHGRAGADEPWLRAPLGRFGFLGQERFALLRAVPGPQEERFTQKARETFVHAVYTLSADCNRMACKLTGPELETLGGSDILSDGIVEGSVQVASDGRPIVMLADHQTTGGYAKIATLVQTDVSVLAQLRPGDKAGFRYVTAHAAVQLCRQEAARLKWLEEQLT